jgi:2-oxo-3-hexenedioate decarboxylase
MTPGTNIAAIAGRLISAYDSATQIAPITATDPAFDVATAYEVLREIEKRRRITQGWQPVGRKIGFTNRTIWPRYGVYQPMWAHIWAHSVHFAGEGHATLGLASFVQPRIEPEVVFKLKAPVPVTNDALAVLACIEWIAPGFEVVQSHFPDWKFTAADCTAAFGLHGALVVGKTIALTDRNRGPIAAALPAFALTLRRGRTVVDRGVGANVLGSPALALVHLVRVLASQPQFPPLAAGEVITTGTLTDAWPIAPGETWVSDYGTLGIGGVTLAFSPDSASPARADVTSP